MNRTARQIATTAARPNRILIILAAAWMAAAIALGGLFTAPADSDAAGPGTTTEALIRTQL